ncbi:MAG: hypothetical protein ABIF40_00880 [archaeon]
MKQVIVDQLRLHPKLQIQDVYKLLYQAEFGPGHMIKNEQKAWEMFDEEYETTYDNGLHLPLEENISENFCRVNLWPHKQGYHDKVHLFEMFLETARISEGLLVNFKNSLNDFRELNLKFPMFDWVSVLSFYENFAVKGNYPAVRHSEEYKKINVSAYRVIDRTLWSPR